MPMNRIQVVTYLVARLLVAIILLQTLFFKFSASPESVYIFTVVGMEPWGRLGTGVLELIASVMIFIPALTWVGAGLALGLMAGAIFMHLTRLGIEVQGDHGQLFIYAVIVTLCSLYVLWADRGKIRHFLGIR
jgi:uncharacterized membrane protein YphA (DoxX/SURF4 family)